MPYTTVGRAIAIPTCHQPEETTREIRKATYARRERTNTLLCLNSGRDAGRTKVLRVRLTKSPPNVMYFGRWRENQPAIPWDRFIIVGVREDMMMHRIPANGVSRVPAYSLGRAGFDWIARVPTLAYRIASSFRPSMLEPIAVAARPPNPMKYAGVAVRNRSFREIKRAATSAFGRATGSIAEAIILPKARKNTATNGSR